MHRETHCPSDRRLSPRLVGLLLGLAGICIAAAPARGAVGDSGPVPPLSRDGRWLTDAHGRVVILHGFNEVEKAPPYYPAADGFGADDAAFLAAEGFNGLRLGVDFRGLMAVPGVVDEGYIERLAETVEALGRRGVFVLLDFHQDGYAPMFNGNGLPDWMAISDGLPNPPDAVFPFYYIQNPAMQRAFENFWANAPGPGGIGLQDYFVQGLERVVARFADDPMVIGTELMNEPWPGADWQACAAAPVGCPDLEQQRLGPFYAKGTAAARAIAPSQLVFVEPFVLFNFGQAPTTLPGTDPTNGLSVHSYATDEAGEKAVFAYAVEAAERDRSPVIVTEFGATIDARVLGRLADQMDAQLLSWFDWAYNESIIARPHEPAGPDNLRSVEAFAALVRPYPLAVAGTPTRIAFDAATGVFEFEYDTVRPSGGPYQRGLATVVSVPARHYPHGYHIEVDGARVTSRSGAPRLVLEASPAAQSVSVRVEPRAAASGICRRTLGGGCVGASLPEKVVRAR